MAFGLTLGTTGAPQQSVELAGAGVPATVAIGLDRILLPEAVSRDTRREAPELTEATRTASAAPTTNAAPTTAAAPTTSAAPVAPAVAAPSPAPAPAPSKTPAPKATTPPAAASGLDTTSYAAAASSIGLRGSARWVYSAVRSAFGITTMGGYRAGDSGDHGSGLAVDIMVGSATGDQVAAFVIANYKALNVKYVIWKQRIWMPGMGWKYMADRGSATANHYDHVHVSVNG